MKKKVVIKKKKVVIKKKTSKIIKKKVVGSKKVTKKKVSLKKKKVVAKKKVFKKNKEEHKLKRFVGNPIIFPANGMYWESRATFNPTAFEHDGKIHVVYRAVGESDVSTLGYAHSIDGFNLKDRMFKPVFIHKNNPSKLELPVFYASGGGWNGGAEDPRITKIEDKLFMTYTAFDGWGSVRIGLTSVSLEDFLNKKWNWKEPILISPPGEIHKNWAVFPEKIKGKYAIIHSISPKISIDYLDNLDDLGRGNYIKSSFNGNADWDTKKEKAVRGIGPAPIKTKLGWLVLYHAMERKDPDRYKLFTMILDLKDPTKIIYNSKEAVLEPDAFYENEGYKSGVVYSCGAVIKNSELFVYYGGADMVACVATVDLDLFLKKLKENGALKLNKK